jgi:hypothetical protein
LHGRARQPSIAPLLRNFRMSVMRGLSATCSLRMSRSLSWLIESKRLAIRTLTFASYARRIYFPSLKQREAGLLQGEGGPPGLRIAMQARPLRNACHAVSVRQAEVLPPASLRTRLLSGPGLAAGPLLLAGSSRRRACSGLSPPGQCPCRAHIFPGNGRLAAAADPAVRENLRRARCRACANDCPACRLSAASRAATDWAAPA